MKIDILCEGCKDYFISELLKLEYKREIKCKGQLNLTSNHLIIHINTVLKSFCINKRSKLLTIPHHYKYIGCKDDANNIIKILKKETVARFNDNKPQFSFIDFDALEPLVRVLEFGAKKYDRNNWRNGDLTKEELLKIWESGFRHMKEIQKGIEFEKEDNIYDPDSKVNHIGNCMANLMFLSYHLIVKSKKQQINKPLK